MNLSDELYHYIADMLRIQTGMVLREDKRYLLETRLAPVARTYAYASVSALLGDVRNQPQHAAMSEIIEAMMTHESMFFRDQKPFDYLRQHIIPHIISRNASSKRLHIWSAACAGGQEPYSIAICLKEEYQKLQGWSSSILATDLSAGVIEKAKEGVYSQFEVQRGLPQELLQKYFSMVDKNHWRVRQVLKNSIQFEQANLLHDFYPADPFDIVFCRNVLIYCDDAIKRDILSQIAQVTQEGAILFLGSAETIMGLTSQFVPYAACQGLFIRK